MRKSLQLILVLASVLALVSADFLDVVTNLYSVSTASDDIGENLKTVSMQGGPYLYIKGSGFSTRSPTSNKVTLGDAECPVIEYLTTSTQVVCQIPPSDTQKKVDVRVIVDDIRNGTCSLCSIAYNYTATPQLIYMIPNAGNPGEEVNFYGKQRIGSSLDVDYVKIGDHRCDASEQNEFNPLTFNPHSNQQLPCNVPDIEAGYYNVSQRNLRNAGFANKLNTVPVYRFGNNAYDFAVVPKISSISNNKGSSEGQIITVKGSGFSSIGQNEVSLGGTQCKILKQSSTEIECELQPRNTPILEQGYHSGLKFEIYTEKEMNSVRAGTAGAPSSKKTRLVSEIGLDIGDSYTSTLKGYFKAPVTGNYKFFVSGDAKVQLYFGKTPLDKTNLDKIVELQGETGYKFFFGRLDSSQFSDNIPLTAGDYYYMEMYHQAWIGADYATVGVLVPNVPNTVSNPPEVQSVKITCQADAEVLEFRLQNVEGGKWKIRFDYLSSDGKRIENSISTDSISYNVIPIIISSQLWSKMEVKADVTRKMLKSDGTETTSTGEAKTFVYTATLQTYRKNGLLPVIDKSELTGALLSTKVTQLSVPSAPIRGTFNVIRGGKTVQLNYNTDSSEFENKLRDLGFSDPIRVARSGDPDIGSEWRIQFNGDKSTPIEPLTFTSALTGCKGSAGISVSATTLQESSNNLFYEVIPFDLLFTAEQNPQITVKSNGITANCPGFNCDYILQDTGIPEVLTFSYVASTLSLTANGVTAGGYTKDKIRVFFGNTECVVSAYSDSSSPATLTANCPVPEAGEYYPKVHFDGFGFAKISASLSKISINAVVSNVSPNQVNPNGGTILTITGTGFPASIEVAQQRSLEVKIGSTVCNLNSVTPTQIQCTTTPIANTGSLTVTLNGKTGTSSPLTLLTTVPTINSISPNSVNPVLQTDITISGNNFDSNIAKTKILLSNTHSSQITECLPFSSTPSEIKCKLLGASTGTYNLYAQTSLGYSNTRPFESKTVITSISPASGSCAGGTILTIQGGSFSNDKQQTLVTIGDDSLLCDVISSTPAQVQCKTRPKLDFCNGTPEDLVVATRIVEESLCESGGAGCKFTYLDSLTPIVNSVSATTVAPGGTLQITGTGFESNPPGSSPLVTLDGLTCTITANTDTQITFTVPGSIIPNKAAVLNINVLGKGDASFGQLSNKLQVPPVISSITPTSGSRGGALITLNGAGFQSGVSIKIGTSTCDIRSLTSTTIICKTTTQGEAVLTYKDFSNIKCISTCSFAFSSSLTPTVTSLSPTNPPTNSFVLTIQGTKFNTGPLAVNLVSQIDRTILFTGSVTSSTSTQITVSFTEVAAGTYSIEVACGVHVASSTFAVDVPLSVSVSSPTESSIAGGATLTITGSGFFDNSQKEKNQVSLCGFPCKVIQSSINSVQCQTPLFINAAVKSTYNKLVSPSLLKSETTWSDSDKQSRVFDLAFTTSYKSTLTDCQIGIDYGASFIAELTEVKYFPNPTITASTFNNTVIEGSNDNVTYTVISTIDENAHDGWNSINLESQTSPIRYRYYRLRGASSTAKCSLAELQFFGVILSESSISDLNALDCKASVTVNDKTQQTPTIAVSYKQSKTATLTSVSPTMGTTAGGTTLTLTGTGFATTLSQIKVYIDDVECSVQTATSTQITCLTGPAPSIASRKSSLDSEIKIQLLDRGYVVSNNIKYFYIDKWSDLSTWGGITPPREGESVSIPAGQTILLDISPPKLKAIIIEGALIFDDANIDLHCEYIFIRGGRLQIGTWENPIQNKVTITLYGNKESPQLPRFGNKVIALMEGILDIHGKPRSHTWTMLDTTAAAGANSIRVQGAVDWKVGEQIVIASTEHDHYQSESRQIATVTPNSPSTGLTTITFIEPLKYKHYAGIQTIDGQTFEMRAEVGLLTRNVVIQGDESSKKLLYGVHIMAHSATGDDSSIGRISYIEIRQAGQAFNLGRYAIHFHLIGNVRESYVIGNAIHHTYNRAVTIHGVHFLKVQKNVAYWCMGHTIFIEDGIETHNVIEDNLVINTIASTALLNTDQTPASFWITNPNNIWRRNHAAGSDRYGFWFDLRVHPEGPSATNSICPTGEPLGEFTDNQAHSSGRYGLRIFHEFAPRKYPCTSYFKTVTNPPVQAEFKNFLGWKNMRNAIIGQGLGAIKFKNIKAADNLRAGIEITDGNRSPPDTLLVEDAWIVGMTPENAGDTSLYAEHESRGLITPQDDFFLVKNVHFSNFGTNMTAIETCSHCEHPAATDSGARTTFFQGLKFSNVNQRVRFNIPFKEILVDRDGSLTGNTAGGKGVVTYYYNHLNVPGCVRNELVYNGLVCDERVTIRRVEFANVTPVASFDLQKLNILRVEASTSGEYSAIPYRSIQQSWATPFATGYTYKLSWASRADFTGLAINPSQVIQPDDKTITLAFNHSEYRETFSVVQTSAGNNNITNTTILWDPASTDTPTNGVWYHDSLNRVIYLAINGKDKQNLLVKPAKCAAGCVVPTSVVQKDGVIRLWSNATQWPNQRVPQDGDNVEIPGDWTVKLDINTSNLSLLHVKGDLYFDSTVDNLVLTADRIWVEGQLFIGKNESDRYTKKAKIVLTGLRNSTNLILGSIQDVGNKVLAVTGNLTMYGEKINHVYVRLQASVRKGETTITVPSNVDWKVGDDILISPTLGSYNHYEVRQIQSINNGTITLNQPLKFYHLGANTTTKDTPYGTIDMRAEIGLLSRNIKIEGSDEDSWGGRVYVGEIYDPSFDQYIRGRVDLDGVEMKNVGQANTTLAGLTFERLVSYTNLDSSVKRSVVRDSLGNEMKVVGSNGIVIEDNIFFKGYQYQIVFQEGSSNIKFRNNLVVATEKRQTKADLGDAVQDMGASFYADVKFTNSEISGNIIAGCYQNCLITKGGDCTTQQEGPYTVFNNVAHSGQYGWLVTDPNQLCNGISHFIGYKLEQGLATYFASKHVKASHLIITDTRVGISLNTGGIKDVAFTTLKDSYVAGVTFNGDLTSYKIKEECSGIAGVILSVNTGLAKTLPPSPSKLPWFKPIGDHIWQGTSVIKNVTFENFVDNIVPECINNFALKSNQFAPDTSASTKISGLTLNNVGSTNKIYFEKPKGTWIGVDNCGGWFCTGIDNIIVRDLDGTLAGEPATLIPANPTVFDDQTCTTSAEQNAHICKTLGWGLLTFENLDSDKMTRLLSPVILTSTKGYKNQINSYMDKAWDGFYTGLKRLSRFHAVAQDQGHYKINFTGTLPSSFKWAFQGALPQEYITVEYQYTNPQSVKVTNQAGEVIKPIFTKKAEDKVIKSTDPCGANIYNMEDNKITLKITGDDSCKLEVTLVNSVRATVRYAMTVDEFFAKDGPTAFIDRVAAILKINPASIRIIDIKSGSTIIHFDVDSSYQTNTTESDAAAKTDIQDMVQKLTAAVSSGELRVLDSEILDSSFDMNLVRPTNNETNNEVITSGGNLIVIIISVVVGSIAVLVGCYFAYVRYNKRKAMQLNPKILKISASKIVPDNNSMARSESPLTAISQFESSPTLSQIKSDINLTQANSNN